MADQETQASALYRLACEGDMAAQVHLSHQLMELAPHEPAVLLVAEAWSQEVMKQNEVVGAYGVAQARLRRGTLALGDGREDEATEHYAAVLALLDGIADEEREDDGHLAGMIEGAMTLIGQRGLAAPVLARAKEMKQLALSHGE